MATIRLVVILSGSGTADTIHANAIDALAEVANVDEDLGYRELGR